MEKMKNLIKLLFLLTIIDTSLYSAKNIGTYCFESPHIFENEKVKVKKVVLHFEDFNHSSENGSTIRMFYFLENDNRRYRVPDLYIYYDKTKSIYHGGVERDGGGFLAFDAINNQLQINEILEYGATIDFAMLVGFESPKVELDNSLENIVPISDVLRGTISTSFLAKKQIIDNKKGEMFWVKGEKCTDSEDIEAPQIFYTEKEYIEREKSSKIEDEYVYLFYEPFGDKKELNAKTETIYLKKSYTNIADMMQEEGFNSTWMKPYTIRFFLYNNKRALIHIVSTDISDKSQYGCSCSSYYLLELHQNILKKMSFGLECGEFSKVIIFEQEPSGGKKND